MANNTSVAPEDTAIRVALWRALHVEVDAPLHVGIERTGAKANGTPFISFLTPAEMLTLAKDAGFKTVRHVSAEALAQRYFTDRTDGLRPPNNAEELLVAST